MTTENPYKPAQSYTLAIAEGGWDAGYEAGCRDTQAKADEKYRPVVEALRGLLSGYEKLTGSDQELGQADDVFVASCAQIACMAWPDRAREALAALEADDAK